MNDDDDIMNVQPSPPSSPKQEPLCETIKLHMQVHLPSGAKDTFVMDFSSTCQLAVRNIRPVVAQKYSFNHCTMFFAGKKLRGKQLVTEVV